MKRGIAPAFAGASIFYAMLAGVSFGEGPGGGRKPAMRNFDTPYYALSTDIPDAMAREADLRMTRMFEEYKRRTSSFSHDFQGKFPFVMFTNAEDYYAAGAMPGSAGQYGGGKLMAIAGAKPTAQTWHVVQHEGFHQFAAMTINARLPVWLNEGLAEYFGEAIFTGDNFVSGVIPPRRLKQVKEGIQEKTWKSFQEMTSMSPAEWALKLDYENYTQAWAMTHFLARGENDKYQKAFGEYINQMNRGTSSPEAWANVFGKDTKGFQDKCEKWWLSLPDDPTKELTDRAEVLSLTSILARAEAEKQSYATFDEFLQKARPTDMKLSRDLWLPEEFVETAVKRAPKVGAWTLERPKGLMPKLVCVTSEGTTMTGTFVLNGKKVGQVNVVTTPKAAETKPGGTALQTKPGVNK